jgi:nucleolin
MAVKTEKAKKSATKKSNFDASEKVSKTASKKKVLDDDDWEKADEEEDSWDPDFDEFDIPKSKTPKKAGKGKKGKEEDAHASDDVDDLNLDDDLSLDDDDLFGDKEDDFEDDY